MLRQVLAYGRATGTAYPRSAARLGDSSPRRVPPDSEPALLYPPVAAAEHRRPGRKGPDEVRAKPGMASQSAGPGTARRVARPGREAQGTPDRSLSGATAPGVLSFRPFSLDEQRKGTRPSGAERNGPEAQAITAIARHRVSAGGLRTKSGRGIAARPRQHARPRFGVCGHRCIAQARASRLFAVTPRAAGRTPAPIPPRSPDH